MTEDNENKENTEKKKKKGILKLILPHIMDDYTEKKRALNVKTLIIAGIVLLIALIIKLISRG